MSDHPKLIEQVSTAHRGLLTSHSHMDSNSLTAPYLVKSHHVNAPTEVDVLGVDAVDASLLQPLLGEGVVSSKGRWQHRVDDECEDVETVEETLPERPAQADPHVERVGHADHAQGQEDSDRLEEVIVECQV